MLSVNDRIADLLQAGFDSNRVWPAQLPAEFNPQLNMALGKNPGLTIRSLHADGITGEGIGIALIDQSLLVDHQEYKERLKLYEEIHYHIGAGASMHGPTVVSIAVGKEVGVAPGADLYFIAEWHEKKIDDGLWDFVLTPLAQAIDRIVQINATLSPDGAIRVISISLGINPRMAGHSLTMESIKRASEAGIYTVYVDSAQFFGLGRDPLADPDTYSSFGPGQFWSQSWRENSAVLVVPMDSRCTATPFVQ